MGVHLRDCAARAHVSNYTIVKQQFPSLTFLLKLSVEAVCYTSLYTDAT